MKTGNKILDYVLIGSIIFAIWKILQFIGVFKDQDEINTEAGSKETSANPLSPKFWQYYRDERKNPTILTTASATQKAEQIRDAAGFFNDDESAIFSVFRTLKTQTQASFLADRFQTIYNESLIEFLNDTFDEEEFSKVYQIVRSLPKFRA
jgi:hypothetical protein